MVAGPLTRHTSPRANTRRASSLPLIISLHTPPNLILLPLPIADMAELADALL
jgi:hypothetical protein